MTTLTIDTRVFDLPEAKAYFGKADHRILCGCRATLEMLGIPLPEWASRKPSGPKPGRAIMAAFRADHPETLHEATMRKVAEHTSRIPARAEGPGVTLSERIAALKGPQQSAPRSDDPDPLCLLP
jgi:hypothetical protein